ncbi:MAG: cellulase family glycosylhydrolase [Hamadaea sp.]|uniref:cellulase family glycosylhydrolase n=1 Tax=Hamadaea sp. TaxID=2024425 RepID=UPI00181EBD35|nr:cellulase family glycosylhydrolase [Hamadaea sp.]NUR70345.1 cellulase family glycosylhydrolase [Hamadaea sp.]NUT21933.1 cellulase family glycosylhydrolase [Hamadaea sp.]
MKKALLALSAAALTAAASLFVFAPPAYAATGLHISGRNVVEANGQNFIMRGVNHPHVWYTSQTSSFANVKALGANTIRVVLGSGKRWGPSSDVANVISLCKQNKLICVLEVHDTTGYGEDGAAATLDEAVNYWITQKSVLVGQENYVIINIGNEPIGNTNPSQWIDATSNAVKKMRSNGFEHMLMVDAPNWGQDWQNVMRDNAQTIWNADTLKNTLFSIHMYSVYSQASTITSYFDAFQTMGLPLVIGEFGWQFSSGEVDHETILAQAQARGLGYLGWSWSGNTDPILDMATSFNPAQLTTWGQRIFNGTNGIKATAKEATIFSGVTSPSASTSASASASPSPSVSPSRSPSASPSTSPTSSGGKTCTATYTIVNSWPGGFQADVKVTAGSAAISGWAVSWTFANGQTVTQMWSATPTTSGASVTARNVSYNGSLAAAGSTSFGFLGSWNGTNAVPAVSCSAS